MSCFNAQVLRQMTLNNYFNVQVPRQVERQECQQVARQVETQDCRQVPRQVENQECNQVPRQVNNNTKIKLPTKIFLQVAEGTVFRKHIIAKEKFS